MAIRIILADDHAIFRQGLAQLLEAEHGFELLAQVASGRAAWELIEALQPDMAILDITMTELTGIEVARNTIYAGYRTRVVLLTMHGDPSMALEAQEAGAAGYVLKDNTFEELVTAVRTVVAGGTFMTASVQDRLRDLQSQGRTTIQLSRREREVIKMIALGHSSKEIGRLLGISPRTVDTYRNRLMGKLDLKTLADVVRYAVRAGLAS
jgi:DNA-binding NarL/FixJ family response regulator